MKTLVLNSITKKASKNFEKNVSKLLPRGVSEIYLSSCGMERVGTGSNNYFLEFKINDVEYLKLKKFTNSSPAWDEWTDIESGTQKHDNFNKATALMILEDCKNEIEEYLNEDNE